MSGHDRPTGAIRRRREPDVLAVIAGGGFIGTLGRYELGLAWKQHPGGVPWATFTVNTAGAFLLGLILTVVLRRLGPTSYLRPFLCVGVLGAWTTMSTFAVEVDLLVNGGYVATAAAYAALTVVAGLSAARAGALIARALVPAGSP